MMAYRDSRGRFTKRPEPLCGGVLVVMLIVVFLCLLARVARSDEPEPPCPAMASIHDPVLDTFAQAHAERQAACCYQGHQGFEKRAAKLLAVFPGRQVAEICAESWPEQEQCSEAELWAEAVRCWKQSPDHWSVASKRHWRIGAGLAKGENGTWYLTILAID